jgi:hypothetical protein
MKRFAKTGTLFRFFLRRDRICLPLWIAAIAGFAAGYVPLFEQVLMEDVDPSVFVHLGLNSLWLNMITGQAWLAILAPRVANGIIMAPVMVFAIWLVEKRVLSLPAILREREA